MTASRGRGEGVHTLKNVEAPETVALAHHKTAAGAQEALHGPAAEVPEAVDPDRLGRAGGAENPESVNGLHCPAGRRDRDALRQQGLSMLIGAHLAPGRLQWLWRWDL